MATVADLGARTLRRLGFSLVAQSQRPAPGPTSTAADIAAMVLRDRGVPVAEADRPEQLPPQTQGQVAALALRLLGVGQATSETLGVVAQSDIIARALRLLGVNPADTSPTYTLGGSYALADAASATLRKLDVVASDDTPSTPDITEALRVVTVINEGLVADGLAYWVPSAIPSAVFEHIVTMAANQIASYFGKAPSLEAFTAARSMIVAHALNGQNAISRAQSTLTAVHGDLAGRGLVDWTISTIPAGALESYVTLVADGMAPVYGKERSPEQAAAAEAQVRRFALSGTLGAAIAQDRVGQVHDALNVQGLVSWPVSAIPAAYADDYAVMASILLATFAGMPRDAQGRQVDQTAWDAATAHVRRGAMIAGMQARALAKVMAVHNEIDAMGLVNWDIGSIPASMSDAYAEAATALMGSEDGAFDPKVQAAAYQRIRMVAMNGPAGQALAEQKVRAVYYDLAARGRIQWTLLNIPRYAEEPFVLKAAALLAPELGMEADMQASVSAEQTLARITMVPSARRPVRVPYF